MFRALNASHPVSCFLVVLLRSASAKADDANAHVSHWCLSCRERIVMFPPTAADQRRFVFAMSHEGFD